MKALLRKVLCLSLMMVLIVPNTGIAYAYDEDYFNDDAFYAGVVVSAVMETIMENYKGDDIDYDQLLIAALSGMTDILDENSAYMVEEDFNEFMADILPTQLFFGIVFTTGENGSIKISQIYDGSSAIDAGLMTGDVLLYANGHDVSGMTVSQAIDAMNDMEGNEAVAIFQRGETQMEVRLEKRELPNKTVYTYEIDELLDYADPEKIAGARLIEITSVGETTDNELEAVIQEFKDAGVRRVILDLRSNTGGYFHIALNLCKMLVDKGPILVKSDRENTLTTYYSTLSEAPFEEIVVLVDGITASAAEILTVCLKERGATVIGQQTYGKGSIQNLHPTYGGTLKLTGGEYLSAAGVKIDGEGIAPDILVDLPDLLLYNLETTGEDILEIKRILAYCGYETGELNEDYDDITKASVVKVKELSNMEPDDKIDIYFKDALNLHYLEYFMSGDKILDRAYAHMFE